MKVFSWNVQGRVKGTLRHQTKAVLEREPDIVALQEVTTESFPGWQTALRGAGYQVASAIDLIASPYPAPPYPTPLFPREIKRHIKRRAFNLTAARHPVEALPGLSFEDAHERRYAFPEKYAAVRVDLDGTSIHVHNVHLPPGSSRGLVKVHAYEAIRRRVDVDIELPLVLCGDFNAPWSEDAKGPIRPLRKAWLDEKLHARWLEAEAALVANPHLRDVYRDVHEDHAPFPVSHWTGRRDKPTPHRYDYIFASRHLRTNCCRYLSDWLERDERGWRASDHAPVEAELSLRI